MCRAQKASIYNTPSSLLHPSLGLGPGCRSSVTRVPAPIRQSEAWKPCATTTSKPSLWACPGQMAETSSGRKPADQVLPRCVR